MIEKIFLSTAIIITAGCMTWPKGFSGRRWPDSKIVHQASNISFPKAVSYFGRDNHQVKILSEEVDHITVGYEYPKIFVKASYLAIVEVYKSQTASVHKDMEMFSKTYENIKREDIQSGPPACVGKSFEGKGSQWIPVLPFMAFNHGFETYNNVWICEKNNWRIKFNLIAPLSDKADAPGVFAKFVAEFLAIP